jgi:hypothetical protein
MAYNPSYVEVLVGRPWYGTLSEKYLKQFHLMTYIAEKCDS